MFGYEQFPVIGNLEVSTNSQLKMLNIKGNPSLQNLDCRSCALQSLDYLVILRCNILIAHRTMFYEQ